MSDKADRKIDTVIFDFDGTLMDTNDAILSSWQHTARVMTGREFPEETLTATFGEPIPYTVSYLFPDHDKDTVISTYRKYNKEHFADGIDLFPGVREMLVTLYEGGYKIGLVTNRQRVTTEIGLDKFDLSRYFGAVVTVGEAPKDKPAPEHIWFTLDKLGSSADRAVLVGDSQNDIIGGHNAGLISVRVAWAVATDGGHGEAAARPDYIIDTPMDLVGLMERINQES
jgi:pyrophosphatase PpaX